MGVCVVLVGDAVVVAVAILTTTIVSTFKPLWSGTDLSHMPKSSAPLALVHAAHRRVGRGWRFLLVPPSSVRATMYDERNDEAVVAAADTVAVASAHRHVTATGHSTPQTTDDIVGVHRAVAVC